MTTVSGSSFMFWQQGTELMRRPCPSALPRQRSALAEKQCSLNLASGVYIVCGEVVVRLICNDVQTMSVDDCLKRKAWKPRCKITVGKKISLGGRVPICAGDRIITCATTDASSGARTNLVTLSRDGASGEVVEAETIAKMFSRSNVSFVPHHWHEGRLFGVLSRVGYAALDLERGHGEIIEEMPGLLLIENSRCRDQPILLADDAEKRRILYRPQGEQLHRIGAVPPAHTGKSYLLTCAEGGDVVLTSERWVTVLGADGAVRWTRQREFAGSKIDGIYIAARDRVYLIQFDEATTRTRVVCYRQTDGEPCWETEVDGMFAGLPFHDGLLLYGTLVTALDACSGEVWWTAALPDRRRGIIACGAIAGEVIVSDSDVTYVAV